MTSATSKIVRDILIVVDTREQLPYTFPRTVSRALQAGDYSIDGLEDRVAVERKSLPDLFGSVGKGRDRFRREWERLAKMERAAVVIEASLSDVRCSPPAYSAMHPRAVVQTLIAWSVRYDVHVVFAGSRRFGQAYTGFFLAHFYNHIYCPWRTAGIGGSHRPELADQPPVNTPNAAPSASQFQAGPPGVVKFRGPCGPHPRE